MAYITKEDVADIRFKLKLAYPEIKFSVRREDSRILRVTIVSSEYDFLKNYSHPNMDVYFRRNGEIGYFEPEHAKLIDGIYRLCNEKNYNNSQPEIDYYQVGYYFYLHIGRYDKPYVITTPKKKKK